jgi:outer membrane immunogenic protein
MGSSNSSVSATVVNPIVPGALNRISQDLDIVTIRANYRFGGSVVAGY